MKGPFLPSDFEATLFSSGAEKANFGNELLRFFDTGYKLDAFTGKLYQRLSNCFGHIAHCDRHGFFETWFASDEKALRFLQHLLNAPCWGDAKHTFSDVERAVQREILRRNYVAAFELRAFTEMRAAEIAVLERLEAKYRSTTPSTPQAEAQTSLPALESALTPDMLPLQGSLFG